MEDYRVTSFGNNDEGYQVLFQKKRWYGWQTLKTYYCYRYVDMEVIKKGLNQIISKLNHYANM